MMKYICAHEVISTHYEVKKFLSLEKLRNRNDFDPAQDPEIESGSSGSATQGAGQWSSWKNSNMSPSDFNYEETLTTLRYASRAKMIKNKPRIN